MRVLMVAHAFPRAPDDPAGATLWQLAEAIALRGHTVRVIAPSDRGDVGAPLLGQVEVRRVRYASPSAETLAYQGGMHARAGRSPVAAFGFARLIRAMARVATEECAAGGFHVVHAHWWIPGGVVTAIADRHGRPLVITLHGTDVRLARTVPGARLALRAVLKRANLVTAVASYLADEAAVLSGMPRANIPVIGMPIAASLPGDAIVGVPHGVVFAGRLTRSKGVAVLLESLALLRKQGYPLDLTVVGDGPERVALKAQALALGLPVVFTGFVASDQVPGFLAGKRVLVLPSLEAGRGRVVAESLAQGVPVVATECGGAPDFLTEDAAGLLVPPGDAPALAAAIRAVATDDAYLTGAVNASRGLHARLSPASLAAAYEAAYLEARGARRSTGKLRTSVTA